jgi:O-antigen/teichoic acid export membrane protein
LLLSGLGDYSYGLWQIITRMVGFLSPAAGKPTQALRSTLAKEQASADYEQKRRNVGSTIIVWAMFLPLIGSIGGVLAWFSPMLLRLPTTYTWILRIAAGLLVINLAMINWTAIPRAVLQGENQSYRRMGLSAIMVFVGGGLTWVALYFRTGLVGIAAATLLTQVLNGLFFFLVVKDYIRWFGIVWPPFKETLQFLGLSAWFVSWDVIMSLMMASDVVVLGLFKSVEAVTPYTLTKTAPEILISTIAILVIGIIPGLGGIIGKGDLQRAARLRSEIMSVTWLVLTALGATTLLWNRVFLNLWVGPGKYAGTVPNLMSILLVSQFVLIRNDSSIIDLTLRLKPKVLLGLLSTTISIVCASLLVGYFKMGIVGLCLGIMTGRLILSAGYPLLISRLLKASVLNQLKGVLRPVMITIFIFGTALVVDKLLPTITWPGARSWFGFFFFAGLSGIIILIISFFAGLTNNQRSSVMRRARMVYPRSQIKTGP